MPKTDKLTIVSSMCIAIFFLALIAVANAQSWQSADATSAGWSVERLNAARDYAMADRKTTAIMVMQGGKVIASWGDTRRKVDVASVRKSLLSALYGIAVSEHRIGLDSTLAELGIDDKPPALTATEKQATVRDLLMARSGIYHVAAHETTDIRQKRPQRGSHAHGSFWFYNNWDFNALGTIYRQRTGEDIFLSFYQRVALPIGMEDFSASDGRYSLEESSVHPAYRFRMSARDLARVGQLYLDGGRWSGRQIISAAWVKESTTPFSRTDRGSMGYGYLWWTLNPQVFGSGAAVASGYGGQHIAIVPSKRLVVVQTVDPAQTAGRQRTSHFVDFLRSLVAAAP
ncbi:serine hydrolase domain-containing protein [Chelatococcus asaccharovorans]|uniref:serine hydrolase domain-containing protein n=1 Tax=Chelatococcus asaccharovorans TaxID=28210 RepID=UPI00224C7915|nr:serine hydrolase [Chelatococcus asaccharovorans]CAH1657913.1 CubicO group peptidase (Beta-lactamase class C family) [Chelatococcus asaccharovorans]CAH1688949.1 CubicO group peptidase (Beta-lactamase class C family) [Chelatococcus asaccharovorans]